MDQHPAKTAKTSDYATTSYVQRGKKVLILSCCIITACVANEHCDHSYMWLIIFCCAVV
jgi:hypothetical protein